MEKLQELYATKDELYIQFRENLIDANVDSDTFVLACRVFCDTIKY